MILNRDHFTLKFADTEAELEAAQRLRFRVFVEEMGAQPSQEVILSGREMDAFDPYFEHLILKDDRLSGEDNVVGVYRLMQDETAASGPGFYSASEYELEKITTSGLRSIEMGRSCVDARYRSGLALHLLWQGVGSYVVSENVDLLFGVVSFAGTNPDDYRDGLSFLHHNHLAYSSLRVAAHGANSISLDLIPKEEINRPVAARQIPSLLKSYLAIGGQIGEGAYIDFAFNTIDVFVILQRANIPNHRLAHLQTRLEV